MIVYGTRDVDQDAAGARTVDLASSEALELAEGEILQTVFEFSFRGFQDRLPPALHPTHPPLAVIFFYRFDDSPFGPFSMAQVRVSALAGISRFTYPVRGWIDNTAAAEMFGRRWGYRLDPADIALRRRHDRVWGTVTTGGKIILEAGLYDPEPVAGVDATHASHLNLAYVDHGGSPALTLVQGGPQLSFRSCDRGRPHLPTFDADAIRSDVPYWDVSAYAGRCSFLFNPVQFLCDPNRPVLEGGLTLTGGLHSV